MTLHPALAETLSAALLPSPTPAFTRRDAGLSTIPKKAHAVIGMRRALHRFHQPSLAAEHDGPIVGDLGERRPDRR